MKYMEIFVLQLKTQGTRSLVAMILKGVLTEYFDALEIPTLWYMQLGAHDIICGTAMMATEHKSNCELTKDTPYLARTSKLWSVCCEHFAENWLL